VVFTGATSVFSITGTILILTGIKEVVSTDKAITTINRCPKLTG
jgi:hypothetical protein